MPVVRDESGKHRICQRNDARDDNLSARLISQLPHILDADLQIVEQTLGKSGEFFSGFCDGHLPGAAGKQQDAQFRFDLLDRPRQGRLRRFQVAGRGNETSILDNRQNGVELPRTQIGDVARHVLPFVKRRSARPRLMQIPE